MENIITINNTDLAVKEYRGQRVVTLKEIDAVHQRPEGTARKRFNDNKEHFMEDVDYFKVKCSEVRPFFGQTPPNCFNPEADITLVTESGYLMLVKSFTDDLAWKVQRALVKTYFRASDIRDKLSELSPQLQLLINIEMMQNRQQRDIEAVNQRVDNIRDVVALNPNSWRPDARSLIHRIAQKMGGNEYIREVQAEIFGLVNERAGVSLETRLTNKRRRMADEGASKTVRDKLNKVDIIADDKKLIEIYVAIVKEMTVKYGVNAIQRE